MAAALSQQWIVKQNLTSQISNERVRFIAEGTHSYDLMQQELKGMKGNLASQNKRLKIVFCIIAL